MLLCHKYRTYAEVNLTSEIYLRDPDGGSLKWQILLG